mmetsp:Transcript_24188/g.70892  ORF Transcript_24188/g.70892 Transcript_24188/m.70892 type:complete len:652 (-) Transcript_24188:3-1958(-)
MDYISRHRASLEDAISSAMSDVMKVKPIDPVTFMAQRLVQRTSTQSLPLPDPSDASTLDKWSLLSWLADASVHRAIASAIQRGGQDIADDAAVLHFLRTLDDRDALAKVLCTGELLSSLVDIVWDEVKLLKQAEQLDRSDEQVIQAALVAARASTKAEHATEAANMEWSALAWSRSLDLTTPLARALCAPIQKDMPDLPASQQGGAQLAFLRSIGDQCVKKACGPGTIARLLGPHALQAVAKTFCHEAEKLVDSAATVDELSKKFVQQGELYFGSRDDYNGGLEATIGIPHPKILEAMEREHVASVESETEFETGNYSIKTSSRIEWWYVVDPTNGLEKVPGLEDWPTEPELSICKRRRPVPLHTFNTAVAEVTAQLRKQAMPAMIKEELIGARLYTGPMFQKYNCVMRGVGDGRPDWAQQLFQELCQGNTYTTTIWVINSVIVKLGKLTVPEKVYRGVSGRGLPKSMQEKGSGSGVGGVDVAFLSTTVDREVAFCYAKGGSGTGFGLVFEIKQGIVDCGANLSWLSQYPYEREILFAPLTALEVVDARVEGRVYVVEIRPTVNQKAQTIEQVIAKMQHAQVQFVDLLMENFQRIGAPRGVLKPLEALKMSHKLRQAKTPACCPLLPALCLPACVSQRASPSVLLPAQRTT